MGPVHLLDISKDSTPYLKLHQNPNNSQTRCVFDAALKCEIHHIGLIVEFMGRSVNIGNPPNDSRWDEEPPPSC